MMFEVTIRCLWSPWNAKRPSPVCVPNWNSCPEADREILTLRYALDYNTNQIAETLAINATAVHMRLSRARQRLGKHLKALGVEYIL